MLQYVPDFAVFAATVGGAALGSSLMHVASRRRAIYDKELADWSAHHIDEQDRQIVKLESKLSLEKFENESLCNTIDMLRTNNAQLLLAVDEANAKSWTSQPRVHGKFAPKLRVAA